MSLLSKLLGKKKIWQSARWIIRTLLGKLYTDALRYAQQAEGMDSLSDGAAKAEWVSMVLLRKHGRLRDLKWVVNFVIEFVVGELKDYLELDYLSDLKL